jgi:soluble lytic murein transglycosylase-like protein
MQKEHKKEFPPQQEPACLRPWRLMCPIGFVVIAGALWLTPLIGQAEDCWLRVANRYHVSPALLMAIARTESGFNPRAVGVNRNGSRDIGLMQINSLWLPRLKRFGIEEADLFNPCQSIEVGAWILSHYIGQLGYTWAAVGAYNTGLNGEQEAARRYIHKVRAAWPHSQLHPQSQSQAQPHPHPQPHPQPHPPLSVF